MDIRQDAADLGPDVDLVDRRELAEETDPRFEIPDQRLRRHHLKHRRLGWGRGRIGRGRPALLICVSRPAGAEHGQNGEKGTAGLDDGEPACLGPRRLRLHARFRFVSQHLQTPPGYKCNLDDDEHLSGQAKTAPQVKGLLWFFSKPRPVP